MLNDSIYIRVSVLHELGQNPFVGVTEAVPEIVGRFLKEGPLFNMQKTLLGFLSDFIIFFILSLHQEFRKGLTQLGQILNLFDNCARITLEQLYEKFLLIVTFNFISVQWQTVKPVPKHRLV